MSLVRDVMHIGVTTCREDTPVLEAVRTLLVENIETLIVLDENSNAVGRVRKPELVAVYATSSWQEKSWEGLTVAQIMRPDIPEVAPDIPAATAAQLMLDQAERDLYLMHHGSGICWPAAVVGFEDLLRAMEPVQAERRTQMAVIETPVEKWSGSVRVLTLGATPEAGGTRKSTVVVGGEKTLPFLHFEGELPHRPAIAVEIVDRRPADWPQVLLEAWGDVTGDVSAWARAAEASGAELVLLRFAAHAELNATYARQVLRRVLEATGLPLIVFGAGQADLDNEILVAVAEEGKGERLLLGVCEDKNYRTIVAAALAHGHLVDSRTPMDVNLAKQLIILISDMGMPLDRIIMDPSTGALGYGIEYGYSVMERLRLAALQGDSMTQQPMLVTPSEEAWRTKEARAGDGVPDAWGDWTTRAINWETITAGLLINSGADIVALRHPASVRKIRTMIDDLMRTSNQ